jgi:WD40 repeat protein
LRRPNWWDIASMLFGKSHLTCAAVLLAACSSGERPANRDGAVSRDGTTPIRADGAGTIGDAGPSPWPDAAVIDAGLFRDMAVEGLVAVDVGVAPPGDVAVEVSTPPPVDVADDLGTVSPRDTAIEATASLTVDASDSAGRVDSFIPDAPVGRVQDASLSPTAIFSNCATYEHADRSSPATAEVSVLRVLFTPDRNNLISFGTDGRAKVWNITPSGLTTPASRLELAGSGWLFGAIRSDGRQLAVGDSQGTVTVYDFPTSLESGIPVVVAALSTASLAHAGANARPRGFAADGNQLLVTYSSLDVGEPNQVAVWDLDKGSLVSQFSTHGDADYPMAFLLGERASATWIATEETVWSDLGHDTVITLVDMTRPTSSFQLTLPNVDAYSMAFSPDGSTLAIGFGDAEVSLWDIRNKSAMVAIGAPLIAGGSATNWTNAIAYSADGKFVISTDAGDSDCSVRLSSVDSRQTLTKQLDYDGTSVDISRDGLALAVGENNYGVILYCTP